MDIDWVAPFRLAFELFMFLLGWGLVAVISLLALAFVYAVITAIVKTAKKGKQAEARKVIKDFINR